MKKFLLLFLLVVLVIAGYLGRKYFFSKPGLNGLEIIPESAMYILHTQEPVANWKSLSNSGVWKFLKGHPTFREISEYADVLDTLIQENSQVFSLVGRRDLYISAHPVKIKDYDFLFAIDLKKVAELDRLESLLSLTFSANGYKVSRKSVSKGAYLEIRESGSRDILYLSMVGNFMVCTYTAAILENVLMRQEKAENKVSDRLKDMVQITDNKGLGQLYINYQHLDRFMKCYMDETDPGIKSLSKILSYSSLDFNLTDDNVEAEGFTSLNDSADSYLHAFLKSGKNEVHADEVLSERSAVMVSFGFNDFPTFHKNLLQIFEKDIPSKTAYDKWTKQIKKWLKIDIETHLLGWIGGEVAYTRLKTKELKYLRDDDMAVALKATDIEKAKENLDYIQKQIKKRTPARFRKLQFRNHEINYLDMKGFFRIFFGKLFNKFQKPYYTYLGDYVVFSNSPATLVGLIMDYEDGRTLHESSKYQEFKDKFENESSIFAYISGPQVHPLLKFKSSAATWADLKKSEKYITSFRHNGFRLTAAGDKFKTHLYLGFEENMEPYSEIMDSLLLVYKSQVQDISGELDSMDEASRFIVSQLQKGKYLRPYPGSNQNEVEAETDKGKLHGAYREFYEDGSIRVDGQYKRGRKMGVWKYYDSTGSLTEKVRYRKQ